MLSKSNGKYILKQISIEIDKESLEAMDKFFLAIVYPNFFLLFQ